MPVCVACGRWHPTSASECGDCGGALVPAPPPTIRRPPPSGDSDDQARAAIIAAWWDDRAIRLGPAAASAAAAVAARVRARDAPNDALWRSWGGRHIWRPDWEVEEVFDELLLSGADADRLIAEADRWADPLRSPGAADQVARWLKAFARHYEREARRSPEAATRARAALLRRAAAEARQPRYEVLCERLRAACDLRGDFVPGPEVREIADHAEVDGPGDLLDRLLEAAEASPSETALSSTLNAIVTAIGLIVVAVVGGVFFTAQNVIRSLVGRLTGRRRR